MKPPTGELQPQLRDLVDREPTPEPQPSVEERYKILTESSLFVPETKRFSSSFRVQNGEILADGNVHLLTDRCLDIILRQHLIDPTVVADVNEVTSRYFPQISEKQSILNRTTAWGGTNSSMDLETRLWLLFVMGYGDQQGIIRYWPILKEQYFDAEIRQAWTKWPQDLGSLTPCTARDQLLVLAVEASLGSTEVPSLYQQFLEEKWPTDSWVTNDFLLQILVLQKCDRFSEAEAQYRNLRKQSVYDAKNHLWRNNRESDEYRTEDQLLGLLVARGFEQKGIVINEEVLAQDSDISLPEISRLPHA